jgi:lipopolysaccharide export LptBFGC system permease protein LptF
VYAQTGIDQTSNTIETTIKNLFTQIYDNFRIPISAVALTVAAAKFASSDPNGRKQAGLIGAGIILFWIIPGVITFFTDVTQQ